MFEDILLNATTVTEALEFYSLNEMKIELIFEKIDHKTYPSHQ